MKIKIGRFWDNGGRMLSTSKVSKINKSEEKIVLPVELEEGYGFQKTVEGYKIKVIRANSEFGSPSRGGTWYVREFYKNQVPGYYDSPLTHGAVGVGGKRIWRKEITLKNPYFCNITDAKTEGEYPLVLYEKIFQKKVSRRGLYSKEAEKIFSKIESKCSEELRKHDYDGVIFYYVVGVHKLASQIFHFFPFAYEKQKTR